MRIAIYPAFPGFCGRNHGMLTRMRVFRCVLVWRVVATQSRAAFLTRPQVYPLRTDLHAFRAFAALWVSDRCNREQMIAGSLGHSLPLIRAEPCVLTRLQSIPRQPMTPHA